MGLPHWRTVFDKVERTVGAPLEDAVASPNYGKVVAFWVNYPKAVTRTARRQVDAGLASALHLLNVPTRTDVQRLSKQLAVLTGEVRALSVPTDRISAYVEELQARTGELESDQPRALGGSGGHGA